MSELLDKQVNAQKEKTFGVHASSHKPTKNVCDENEGRNKQEKNDMRVKLYSWKEALYNVHVKNR